MTYINISKALGRINCCTTLAKISILPPDVPKDSRRCLFSPVQPDLFIINGRSGQSAKETHFLNLATVTIPEYHQQIWAVWVIEKKCIHLINMCRVLSICQEFS